jgi:TnpA family transposase
VHALAHLFGFELLTRIRNWKDLVFYRPTVDARYAHIDSLFGQPGENAINWRLIETHWPDLMQVALSIREGRLSSTLLLRRLGTESRRNNIYKAFRELGRVIRTITLLRFISEPELRDEITAATNKVEAYNDFSGWLRFGNDVIARNDPAEQEKIIKFNSLLANCVIFHTALDMTAVIRELAQEGWSSPQPPWPPSRRTSPNGSNASASTPPTGLTIPPAAFDARLDLHQYAADETATASQAA